MPTLTRHLSAAEAASEGTWTPRHDVVVEHEVSAGRFGATTGPFTQYDRTVTADDGTVTEVTSYRLAPLVWGPMPLLYRKALHGRPPRGAQPWWAPTAPPDAQAATALGSLCAMAVVLGYLGSLLTQTITFAADEFGASTADQGTTLAAVRIGVLGAAALTALADRRGRRIVLVGVTATACVASAVTALAPSLAALGVIQAVVRGLAAAGAVLLTVLAAEEMPADARAYSVSLLSVCGALGAGIGLLALPLADVDERGWRLLFLATLLALPAVRAVAGHLPESRRFAAVHATPVAGGHVGRFWLLAASALLVNLFAAPASQLMNEFLRTERGFSAQRISLFTILTNTPAGIGIVVGGRLADRRGRRIVGAVGVAGGVGLTVAMVLSTGLPMWVFSVLAAVVGAVTVPALGVYGPELFPTALRGKANGVIAVLGVTGSAVGLVVAGHLVDRWGGLAPALALLSVGPALMAILVLVAYPETAHRELEDLNPEDLHPSSPGEPAQPSAAPPVGSGSQGAEVEVEARKSKGSS